MLTNTPNNNPHPDVLREYMRLRAVLSEEQTRALLDGIERAQGRAVDRQVQQTVTLVFNDKGHPRWLRVSDDVEMRKP